MTVMLTARGTAQAQVPARGVLFLHSCPRALAPHVEWALAGIAGTEIRIDWAEQPLVPTGLRAELLWTAPPGFAAQTASALRAFGKLRFEVTEDAIGARPGERFASTPALGLFRASIGEHGDVLVHEERLRSALAAGLRDDELAAEIARLIGTPWDDELEPFRASHGDSTVRVLHEVI